jgi:hypothetical protein
MGSKGAFLLVMVIMSASPASCGGVRVSVAEIKSDGQVTLVVANGSTRPVAFCATFASKATDIGVPNPFEIQVRRRGRWETLLSEPDVGNVRAALMVEAGETKQFPVRLEAGTYQAILRYRYDPGDGRCSQQFPHRAVTRRFSVPVASEGARLRR